MKNVIFVWHFWPKNWNGWSHKLELSMKTKKIQKNPCWTNSVAIRRNENLFGGRHGKQLNRLAIP